jgi:surfactin synthase thioesterase subunit/phosphopantetheinyl transferase
VTGTGTVGGLGRWFGAPAPRPDARAVLFCLPYAGAGASAFHGWAEALGALVDVQPLALPGKEGRIAEPPEIDVAAVATALAGRAHQRPYAIYGHSMGARLGFEVVRELRRRGARFPLRLYLGGSRPPGMANPLAGLASAGDVELVARLAALGGVPDEVLAEPELLELLLPAIRADLDWIDRYHDQPAPPLPVPIVAFAGADDPVAAPYDLCGWSAHTSAGFWLHTLPGDHFFVRGQRDALAATIRADLLTARAGGTGPEVEAPAAGEVHVDEVHVWHAQLDGLPGLAAATSELSPSEARRAARLRRPVDRDRFVARSALLRRMLASYGAPAGTEELPRDAGGKPRSPVAGLGFSLSHSAGTVLLAVVAGQEVGVDVERVAPMADLEAFCSSALHGDELVEHRALPAGERIRHALRLWTAKEALLKATGDGLAVEPSLVSFAGQPPGPWRPRVPGDLARLAGWRVSHLELPGALGAVAVALDGPRRLRFWTVLP